MSAAAAELPPSGAYLKSIRSSCRSLREKAGIKIADEAIDRLLLSPSFKGSYQRVSASHGLAMPLKFSSPLDELNLLSVLSLLNFASGYRIPLREQTGRGAWDCIRGLVLSMYISSMEEDLLSAKGIKTMTEAKIAELMRVNIHFERAHESIPGVVVGQLGGPIYELVGLITKVLNETGDMLVSSGYPSLGAFVVEALKDGEKLQSEQPDGIVELLLERLSRAIPGFRDIAVVDGQSVYCFKKALFLAHAINVRFGALSPPPFPVPKTSNLPVFTDNVIPSMLIHLGVMDLSGTSFATLFPDASDTNRLRALLDVKPPAEDQVSSQPYREGPILTPDQAYVLRATAIDACELIIGRAHTLGSTSGVDLPYNEITLPTLDMWLWAVAKDRPDYRALERFVLQDTVFF